MNSLFSFVVVVAVGCVHTNLISEKLQLVMKKRREDEPVRNREVN
jgi:hypothetical protein